jgi:Family of unknown function (DUF5681)
MPTEDEKGYEVGYGKPPKQTRFRKGQSGNPNGRPRGAKNIATLFTKALKERVIVTENGRRRSISKQEALVKHLVNKALSGDRRLLQLLLDEVHVIEARAESTAAGDTVPDETDLRVFRQLHERIRRQLRKGEIIDESNPV